MNRTLCCVLATVLLAALGDLSHGQDKPAKIQATKKLDQKDAEAAAAAATGAATLSVVFIVGIACMGLSLALVMILPIAVAIYRSHPDTMAISIIAIFFGWTIIGWWIALIWAVKSIPRTGNVNVTVNNRDTGPGGDFDFS